VTGSCIIIVIYIYIFFFSTIKSWRGSYYYFNLFIYLFCDEELTVLQDDDVLLSGFLLANAAGMESGG
jgi:hypothetical protein